MQNHPAPLKSRSRTRSLLTLTLIGLVAGGTALCQKKMTKQPIQVKVLNYTSQGKPMEGFLAWPTKDPSSPKPAILVVHEWTGLGDYAKKRAQMLAELGYVAFAMDMYGQGIRAKDHKEAGKLSGTYFKDRALMRTRMNDALAVFKKQPGVDPQRIGAIGYCFGGGAVLELALSGADVKAFVSFHGFPMSPNQQADAAKIKGKVLIHHGGADSMVNMETVNTFEADLKSAQIPVEVVVHEGAPHSFTVFDKPQAYRAEADQESWNSMLELFQSTLQ